MLDFGYYNMDCMDGMKEFPDQFFDLAVVDPQYGINAPNMSMGSNRSRKGDGYPGVSTAEKLRKGRLNQGAGKLKNRALNTMDCSWDKERPKSEYFKELFRVSKNQIIFGYNYFSDMLPPCRGFIVWDKCQPWENFSQAELAWTSFDMPAKLIRLSNTGGANTEEKIHPTQKPIELYGWIYSKFAEAGMKIVDTHVGSATNLRAAYDAGISFVGFEKSIYYYEKSKEKLDAHMAQMNLFAFPEVMPMKFIDLFAGIGGFRRGMELAGHECVGFCEWDKFAAASYTSMHLITDEQRKRLAAMKLKKRQKEILKDEYRNGEWYSNDIRNVDAGSVPRADCWCFGAPCQDFSVAGRRAGLYGDRSSLVREVFRILGEIREEDRPEWLIYENVKGMLSSNRGFDFLEILLAMDELGYDVEWQLFNSKDWGVPQNRERVYTVGHLRRCGARKIFPLTGADGENCIKQLGNYLPTATRDNPNQGRIYSADGIAPCLNKMDGGGREPSVVIPISEDILLPGKNYNQRNVVHPAGGISRTLISSEHTGNEPKVAIPVLTPDRTNKRQNGRRFKEDEEPMFTLTGQDRHGVGISVYDMYNKSVRNDGMCGTLTGGGNTSATHCGSFGVMVPVIEDKTEKGIYVQLSAGLIVYAIWYEKYGCYIAIRRLTPKECFRLQGWEDIYFEHAAFVNSDSQLYKQAGNGVTVNIVYAIGLAIAGLKQSRPDSSGLRSITRLH